MHMSVRLIAASGLAFAAASSFAATGGVGPLSPVDLTAGPVAQFAPESGAARVATRAGTARFRFNEVLLREFGLGAVRAARVEARGRNAGASIDLTAASRFVVDGNRDEVRALAGGSGGFEGHLQLDGDRLDIDFADFTFRVAGDRTTPRIDLVGVDGKVYFYIDRFMYEWLDGGATFRVRSADVVVSTELAALLGVPHAADVPIAELHVLAPLAEGQSLPAPMGASDPNFHGEAVSGVPGASYQADVFMKTFNMQYGGCNGCAGPDGEVKFVPSSTLINNVNAGTAAGTVPGDPLGRSTALHSADVSWYEKFTTSPWDYPYVGNDQHPYLIWNLYRIGADGGIVQIGRSSVKHAFLTTNTGNCAPGLGANHILRRACEDTYGTGNNDNFQDLGPRSEIIPATGQWGRCRSIFDINCDGQENAVSNGPFDRRMLVRESEIDPVQNAGATWMSESWYIVQDDINVYNTMATRPFSSAPSGNGWTSVNGSPIRLGPALDRWTDAPVPAAPRRNEEMSTPEGRTKLASKALALGSGQVRHHYALMNVDFARAFTIPGATSPANLEVVRNLGFNSFEISVMGDATDIRFNDGDDSAANDWTSQRIGNRLVWTAPAGSALNWGTLFSFSFVSPGYPRGGVATLGVAEAGSPASYTMSAAAVDSDALLSDQFE